MYHSKHKKCSKCYSNTTFYLLFIWNILKENSAVTKISTVQIYTSSKLEKNKEKRPCKRFIVPKNEQDKGTQVANISKVPAFHLKTILFMMTSLELLKELSTKFASLIKPDRLQSSIL